MKDSKVHKSIMKTKRSLMDGEEMDEAEAADVAVGRMRKTLLNNMVEENYDIE